MRFIPVLLNKELEIYGETKKDDYLCEILKFYRQPMKLLIVVNRDRFFLSHRKEIAIEALKRGWEVTIAAVDTGMMDQIRAMGMKVAYLPMSRYGMNPLKEFKTLIFLRRLYRKENPDIVHHVGMKAILMGTLAAYKNIKTGIVNAVCGLGSFYNNERTGKLEAITIWALRFLHNQSNVICLFQNSDDRKFFLNNRIIKEHQARLIRGGSGVDLESFRALEFPDDNVIRIILPSRMIKEKGVFLFVQAAEKLRERFYGNAEFILAGELDYGSISSISEQEILSVCDGVYVKWAGYVEDMRPMYASIHIVAFPSYYHEGIPRTLIEANAVGRPVVTFDSVGCRDCVIDGYNGYVVPVLDVEALSEKIAELILSPSLREEMGKHGRQLAERIFSVNDVVDKHFQIYDNLLALAKKS